MRTIALSILVVATLAGCADPFVDPGKDLQPDPAPYMAPDRPTVDPAAVLADLKAFSGAYPQRLDNLPTHEGARGWLLGQFAQAGLTTWRHNFTATGLAQANIVGVHWGQVRDQWVVVGAHYDTTHNDCLVSRAPVVGEIPNCMLHQFSSGTYDDGSGVMQTLHLAKAFANVSTYYSIAFVAYDGEERGLEGATAFARDFLTGETPFGEISIRSALDIDMFGITWPGTDAPTQIIHNSAALFGVFDAARKEINMPDDMVYCTDTFTAGSSDYQVFIDRKIPVVFLISDFGRWAPPMSPVAAPLSVYPNWHLIDTYDTMQAQAGGATQLQQGFATAAHLTVAVLHAQATQPDLELDVSPVPGSNVGPLSTTNAC